MKQNRKGGNTTSTTTKHKAQKMKKVYVREQPRKDSQSKRVNLDNIREDKVKRIIEQDAKKPNRNDISWYSRNPQLLQAAASIPFSSVLGEISSNIGDPSQPIDSVYGIMVLPWSPCLGADDVALNQSFNSQYSYNVHANSRNYAYTAPDLGILELAGIQVFNIIASMIRAFGVVRWYQERNNYLPDALLHAMGFQPKDVRQHRSQMWFDINNLIDQTRQIWIPNTMPIADRWFNLNSNVYTDADDQSISQLYVYVQDAYYIYSETGLSTGSALLLVNEKGEPCDYDEEVAGGVLNYSNAAFNPAYNQYTWEEWMTVAQAMIDALINSEDRGIIFGDILNAYGQDNIRALTSIDSSYVVTPAYNAEVLTQIENWLESPAVLKGIGQTSGNLTLASIWAQQSVMYYSSSQKRAIPRIPTAALINFHTSSQPTPEMVVVGTRCVALGYQSVGGRMTIKLSTNNVGTGIVSLPYACGTEIPHATILYNFKRLTTTPVLQVNATWNSQYFRANNIPGFLRSAALGSIMSFDWHPFFYDTGAHTTMPETPAIQGFNGSIVANYGDHANYSYIDNTVMAKLHRTCLFSLLGVPQI